MRIRDVLKNAIPLMTVGLALESGLQGAATIGQRTISDPMNKT